MAGTKRTKLQVQEDIKKQSKVCGTCGERKNFSEFYSNRSTCDGRTSLCKVCVNEVRSAYRRKHSAKVKKRARDIHLMYSFGITQGDYDAILKSQNYSCAICGIHYTDVRVTSGRTGYLAVDHCHETGGIRGLLCNRCNLALGFLGDSQDLLHKAAKYLKEYEDCL